MVILFRLSVLPSKTRIDAALFAHSRRQLFANAAMQPRASPYSRASARRYAATAGFGGLGCGGFCGLGGSMGCNPFPVMAARRRRETRPSYAHGAPSGIA